MVDAKVIVMEPSDSQALALDSLLRFLDLEPIRVRDLAELRRYQLGAVHDSLALIVGAQGLAEQARREGKEGGKRKEEKKEGGRT